jgi:hypothetical protein
LFGFSAGTFSKFRISELSRFPLVRGCMVLPLIAQDGTVRKDVPVDDGALAGRMQPGTFRADFCTWR